MRGEVRIDLMDGPVIHRTQGERADADRFQIVEMNLDLDVARHHGEILT